MHSNEVNKTAKIAWQRINIFFIIPESIPVFDTKMRAKKGL
jgi:hypothetical protein